MPKPLRMRAAMNVLYWYASTATSLQPEDDGNLLTPMSSDHAQGVDGEEFNEVAEILLQLQDNLTVNPRKRYTTRTVTGAHLKLDLHSRC